MKGMFLGLTTDDITVAAKGCVDWEFVKSLKSRWITFDFEESSIDLGVSCEPRFIIDDVEYAAYHQYFIREGSTITRLLVGKAVPKTRKDPRQWSSRVTRNLGKDFGEEATEKEETDNG